MIFAVYVNVKESYETECCWVTVRVLLADLVPIVGLREAEGVDERLVVGDTVSFVTDTAAEYDAEDVADRLMETVLDPGNVMEGVATSDLVGVRRCDAVTLSGCVMEVRVKVSSSDALRDVVIDLESETVDDSVVDGIPPDMELLCVDVNDFDGADDSELLRECCCAEYEREHVFEVVGDTVSLYVTEGVQLSEPVIPFDSELDTVVDCVTVAVADSDRDSMEEEFESVRLSTLIASGTRKRTTTK